MERDSVKPSVADLTRRILIASADSDLVVRFSAALEQNYSLVKWTGCIPVNAAYESDTLDLVLIDPKYFPDPITANIADIAESNQALRIMVIENHSDRQVDQ